MSTASAEIARNYEFRVFELNEFKTACLAVAKVFDYNQANLEISMVKDYATEEDEEDTEMLVLNLDELEPFQLGKDIDSIRISFNHRVGEFILFYKYDDLLRINVRTSSRDKAIKIISTLEEELNLIKKKAE
ncbi:MAG: hypothetical protein M0Z31_11070 [Clostridia bacterium]|nr:hypothetical protein [Clostridia bacterium]